VLIDATVVRCLLVPALMILMGKINWYLPHWIDRILPRLSIEGAEFFEQQDAAVAGKPEPAAAGVTAEP
jgi:RND superfamily putative drug exporter